MLSELHLALDKMSAEYTIREKLGLLNAILAILTFVFLSRKKSTHRYSNVYSMYKPTCCMSKCIIFTINCTFYLLRERGVDNKFNLLFFECLYTKPTF